MEVSAAVVPTTMVADRPETKAPKGFHSFDTMNVRAVEVI